MRPPLYREVAFHLSVRILFPQHSKIKTFVLGLEATFRAVDMYTSPLLTWFSPFPRTRASFCLIHWGWQTKILFKLLGNGCGGSNLVLWMQWNQILYYSLHEDSRECKKDFCNQNLEGEFRYLPWLWSSSTTFDLFSNHGKTTTVLPYWVCPFLSRLVSFADI